MIKIATIKFFALSTILLLARNSAAAPPDLLSHGTDQTLWAAEVVKAPELGPQVEKTVLRVRGLGDEKRWRTVGEVGARSNSLSNRGEELVIVVEDGWRLVSPSGVRSGTPLPNESIVRVIAGEGDALWAVGELRPNPTTAPATQTATAPPKTTPPTSASISGELQLYQLDKGDWVDRGLIDTGDKKLPKIANLAMIVIGSQPLVALCRENGVVDMKKLDSGGEWQPAGSLRIDVLQDFKLLNLQSKPVFWAAVSEGPGIIWVKSGNDWSGPTPLASAHAGKATQRSLCVALGKLRLLYRTSADKLFEQAYSIAGTADGEPVEATTQVPDSGMKYAVQFFLMAGLVLVIMSSLRRKPVGELAERVRDLALPPLRLRLAAAFVDAIPIAIAFVFMWYMRGVDTPATSWGRVEDLALAAAMLVYLLHTLAFELLLRRSIGKILFGLRVVALDGSRPNASAIVVRNLLRVPDLLLVTFMLFSPLQQRVGDVVAGTLVVSAVKPQPTEESSSDKPKTEN